MPADRKDHWIERLGKIMNRIFKVIYSKTKHCYVVVSELAKNRRKCHSVTVKGKTALAAAVLLAVTSFLPGMPAAQADLYRNDLSVKYFSVGFK